MYWRSQIPIILDVAFDGEWGQHKLKQTNYAKLIRLHRTNRNIQLG
jgi:hypothetical protein